MPNPQLKDYQEKCKKFILQHPKCGVFLDIGYGKTLTTLDAIDCIKARNILIVAPKTIARTTWHAEIEKWGYKYNCYSMVERHDTKKNKKVEIPLKDLEPLYNAINKTPPNTKNCFITTRDRVKHLADWCEKHNTWPFDIIVCDEFQSFKTNSSQRTKAITKLADHTRRFIGLTGTPMPNSLEDIWSEIKILDGGQRLGKYITHFRNEYEYSTMVVNGHSVGWKPKRNAENQVFDKIKDITISVKTDLHLPPLSINDIKIKLSDEAFKLYKEFAKTEVFDLEKVDSMIAFKNVEQTIAPANATVLASKLRQIASGTIYDENHNAHNIHDQKLLMTQYIVDNTGGPVLIAYNYQCDCDKLLTKLIGKDGNPPVKFDGTDEMKKKWNSGEYDIMLLQPASSCHGVNLQEGGSTLVWYYITWNMEYYQQTNGRLYRQGQTKPVVIHRLIAENTLDEAVSIALSKKKLNNDSLLEAVKREIS